MQKILILEDHETAREEIGQIISGIGQAVELYAFGEMKEAYACVMEKTIDLFIIDIILYHDHPEDSSGLQFVETIRGISRYEFTPVIIVTGLAGAKEYSFEKLHCYGYIEKPIDRQRMAQLVTQALRSPSAMEREKTLYYRKNGVIHALERSHVVYAESKNHSLSIHTIQKDTLTIPYLTLKKFLADIDSPDFLYCSRSTVINRRFVETVDLPNRKITMRDGMGEVEIGLLYSGAVREGFPCT